MTRACLNIYVCLMESEEAASVCPPRVLCGGATQHSASLSGPRGGRIQQTGIARKHFSLCLFTLFSRHDLHVLCRLSKSYRLPLFLPLLHVLHSQFLFILHSFLDHCFFTVLFTSFLFLYGHRFRASSSSSSSLFLFLPPPARLTSPSSAFLSS